MAPSGATVVGQEFVRDPVALGQVAQSLLDVLPVKQHTTAEYAYLRQTVRTNNAAVVAEGAVKPTSVYSVTRIESRSWSSRTCPRASRATGCSTTARWRRSWRTNFSYGLQVAVEAKVLTDINATSGIQTQAYATSVLATLRKGLTKLETAGYAAGAIVLHPPKPGLHYAVLDASDDVVRLAECREPLTAQARARIKLGV